jgi:hypothetical protein
MIEAMKQAIEKTLTKSREVFAYASAEAFEMSGFWYMAMHQAIAEAEKQCTHRLVDVTNPVVKSGYMCMASGLIPKLTTSTGSKLTTELPICVKQTGQ